jgi:hypothetical protein
MNSRRLDQAYLLPPPRPIQSGKAAFSSKNGLSFLKCFPDAGIAVGVFLGRRRVALRQGGADHG